MMRKLSLMSPFLLLAACGQSDPPQVQTLDAWCRPVPAGVLSAACYLTMTANTDDRLTAVATRAAERVDVHATVMEGDIIRMIRMDEGLRLPRHQAVALRSGGDHIMLIAPKGALIEGQSVPLTLTFEKAPQVVVEAQIRRSVVR